MATAITSWNKHITNKLNRAPSVLIEATVIDAVREFCEETHIWSVFCSDIDVVADTNSYDLKAAVPSLANIVAIKSIRYKEAKADDTEGDDDDYFFLTPVSEEIEEQVRSGSWIFDEADVPSEYYVDENWLIAFTTIPTHSSTDAIRANVYVKPTEADTTVEDFIYRDHRDAITYGALYRLYEMTSMPWADLKLSEYFKTKFIDKCSDVKFIKYTGKTQKQIKINFPRFF